MINNAEYNRIFAFDSISEFKLKSNCIKDKTNESIICNDHFQNNAFFIDQFKSLFEMGHTVELACNCDIPLCDDKAVMGMKVYNIPFSRSPLSKDNLIAYRELKELIEYEKPDIVHCHTPNAAVITRLVCKGMRKYGINVFYTAHGFHFYKGAPLINWILYYPVEWICAHWTDVLITINNEDFA